jgi:hypothetical protein
MTSKQVAKVCLTLLLAFSAAAGAALAAEPATRAAATSSPSATSTASAAGSESPTVLLEKGIYQEETVGDIDAAMKIYQQIGDQAKSVRGAAAQALYRLGGCYLKKKQNLEAMRVFNALLASYPDEKDLAAKTRRLIERAGGAINEAEAALTFDGKQNFVEVPHDPSLDPTGSMTLECWFKTDSMRSAAILGKREWGENLDKGYQIFVNRGSVNGYWSGTYVLGETVSDGQWHHAALTWDGEARRLFVDGAMTGEDHPGPWARSGAPFEIGGIRGNKKPEDFFDGSFRQVRLSKVDRYGGRGNFTPEARFAMDADTIACWDFSEGTGDILHDKSGHSHNGTLVGDPPPIWVGGAPTSRQAPRVVQTVPVALASDVDPKLDKIKVTFDQKMTDKTWSWDDGGAMSPDAMGQPSYDASCTRCTLPVTLQPGKVYWMGINRPMYRLGSRDFKSAEGTPAAAYVILFATRSADGKPTPLPEDMVREAKAINDAAAATPAAAKALPVGPACRIEATIYEVRLAPEKAGALDAKALTPAAATDAGLEKALADLGVAKLLYRVDQSVDLAGDTLMVGASQPFVTASRLDVKGQEINTVMYHSLGAILKIAGRVEDGGGIRTGLDLNIASAADAKPAAPPLPAFAAIHHAALAYKDLATPGRPFVIAATSAGAPDGEGKAVGFVARIVLGEALPDRPAPVPAEGLVVPLDVKVYELLLPPQKVDDLDAAKLTAAAADPAAFEKALAALGKAKLLYRLGQSVKLSGDRLMVGDSVPIAAGTETTTSGNSKTRVQHMSVGVILKISGRPETDGGIRADMDVELSAQTTSTVSIAPKMPAPVMHKQNMARKGHVAPDQPVVFLAADASTPEIDGQAVAYVVRMVAGKPQPAPPESALPENSAAKTPGFAARPSAPAAASAPLAEVRKARALVASMKALSMGISEALAKKDLDTVRTLLHQQINQGTALLEIVHGTSAEPSASTWNSMLKQIDSALPGKDATQAFNLFQSLYAVEANLATSIMENLGGDSQEPAARGAASARPAEPAPAKDK